MRLGNFFFNQWVQGSGDGREPVEPVTGNEIARGDASGIDLGAVLAFARGNGGAALAALSFGERADFLNAIADVLIGNRDRYEAITIRNGGITRVGPLVNAANRADAEAKIAGLLLECLEIAVAPGKGFARAPVSSCPGYCSAMIQPRPGPFTRSRSSVPVQRSWLMTIFRVHLK